MKKNLVAAVALAFACQVSANEGPREQSETPLEISLGRAEAVVFGYVVAIRTGNCGAREGVGVADVRLEKTGRGMSVREGEVIQVCSPARLLLGNSYVFAGRLDEGGRLVPEVDSIVMAAGRCDRFYRVDYMLNPEVAGKAGDRLYSLGILVPDFATNFKDVIGMDLRDLDSGDPFLCEMN